jgi:hypothetical protein
MNRCVTSAWQLDSCSTGQSTESTIDCQEDSQTEIINELHFCSLGQRANATQLGDQFTFAIFTALVGDRHLLVLGARQRGTRNQTAQEVAVVARAVIAASDVVVAMLVLFVLKTRL